MITLYDYWRSSASYRVRIALGLAGLPFKSIPVDLVAGDQRSPAHLAINPQGLVPVVEMDGHQLSQSLAIIELLDEVYAIGLLPDEPWARAEVRGLAHAIAIDIHPVCNLRVARHAVASSNGVITMEGWMRTFIGPGLAAFEQMIGEGGYCYGNTVTLADICLVPQLYNAERWGVDLEAMPKLRTISARLQSIPAFAAAHPDFFKP